jgi:hypothetical protein
MGVGYHQVRIHRLTGLSDICNYKLVIGSPSWRVITSTWWEGLVLSMILRAMPVGAQAPGRATQANKVKEEGRS